MTTAEVTEAAVELLAVVQSLEAQLADERERAFKAEHQASVYHQDLVHTNDFLNGTAKRREWCGEYEVQMERLNAELASGFQFTKRTARYAVDVRITSTFERTIEIEAKSEAEAQELAENMSVRRVYELASLPSVIYQESVSDECEVQSVEFRESSE